LYAKAHHNHTGKKRQKLDNKKKTIKAHKEEVTILLKISKT
jgi:hypothetical protein